MKRLMFLCGLIVIGLASCENDSVKAAEPVVDTTRRLKIVVGDRALTAVLYANPTARDFASRLPLRRCGENIHSLTGSDDGRFAVGTGSPGRGYYGVCSVEEYCHFLPERNVVRFVDSCGAY